MCPCPLSECASADRRCRLLVCLARDLQEIGHDCTNWTPAVFYDLMRMGDGTGEAGCRRICNRASSAALAGWPPLLCW